MVAPEAAVEVAGTRLRTVRKRTLMRDSAQPRLRAGIEWRPGYDPAMRLVLLHALPLDARMWDASRIGYPDSFVPTLYGLGPSVRDWATTILSECGTDELLVVGSSIGGSCALEVARAAPNQVRGVVLVGAKPSVRQDPRARDEAIQMLRSDGVSAAWDRYWAPLLSSQTRPEVVAASRTLAMQQDVDDLITGVRAFCDRRDHSEFVKSWRGHLLVVSGADDRTPSPATVAREIAGTRARHMIVENAGHYVTLEQPELLERILDDEGWPPPA